jgi:hypothetical protein
LKIILRKVKSYGSTGVPAGSGYTKIYSTNSAFAALKADAALRAAKALLVA